MGAFQAQSLARNDASALLNIDVPITSRTNHFLGGLGDLYFNVNSAVDDLSDFGLLPTLGVGVNWTPIPGYTPDRLGDPRPPGAHDPATGWAGDRDARNPHLRLPDRADRRGHPDRRRQPGFEGRRSHRVQGRPDAQAVPDPGLHPHRQLHRQPYRQRHRHLPIGERGDPGGVRQPLHPRRRRRAHRGGRPAGQLRQRGPPGAALGDQLHHASGQAAAEARFRPPRLSPPARRAGRRALPARPRQLWRTHRRRLTTRRCAGGCNIRCLARGARLGRARRRTAGRVARVAEVPALAVGASAAVASGAAALAADVEAAAAGEGGAAIRRPAGASRSRSTTRSTFGISTWWPAADPCSTC